MFSRWTIRLCTVLGIPVRMHVALPVVAVVMLVQTPGYTRRDVLYGLLTFFGVLLLATFLHELGHALVARGRRIHVHEIVIWPLGGWTSCDDARSPGDHLRVSLAGVLMNGLLAGVAALGMLIRDGSTPAFPSLTMSDDFLQTAWNLNIVLLLLNLLPGLPFDGGLALEGLLWNWLGRPRARGVVLGTGAFTGMGLLVGGIVNGSLLFGVVGAWALTEVARGYRAVRENGIEDERFLGVHDFSQGYTSLQAADGRPEGERERELREVLEEEDRREAAASEERETAEARLDRLLDRIAAEGIDSLSGEEKRFLEEESRRLRARRRGRSPTGR
jgi:Zn-dependent protease